MELVPPPGLGQGGQGGLEGGHGGPRVRPLQVEEGVLEAVRGDGAWGHRLARLHYAAAPQIRQHLGQGGCLKKIDGKIELG